MDHSFDGIVEINNQLPRWWTIMFYVVIVWALLYLLMFPGLGNFDGLLGWKSSNQGITSLAESKQATIDAADQFVKYDREMRRAQERFGPVFEAFAKQDIAALANDEEALKIGQRLFRQNCSQCHGSDARGMTGFPNLTDHDWLYGGKPEKIKETLILGRQPLMPPQIEIVGGEQAVKEVAAYARSLSGLEVDEKLKQAGKARFVVCAACHGIDGKGNQQLGAPNLTDDVWLYGGSERAVIETITYGRAGVMPSFKDTLGEEKAHLLAAYVYSLSQDK